MPSRSANQVLAAVAQQAGHGPSKHQACAPCAQHYPELCRVCRLASLLPAGWACRSPWDSRSRWRPTPWPWQTCLRAEAPAQRGGAGGSRCGAPSPAPCSLPCTALSPGPAVQRGKELRWQQAQGHPGRPRQGSARALGLMSMAKMREAPARLAASITARPTAPRPKTATEVPGCTFAVLYTAPHPVATPGGR